MKILEYIGLDTSRVEAHYTKVCETLERGNFRQAEVKKPTNVSHGKFYRAKLDGLAAGARVVVPLRPVINFAA